MMKENETILIKFIIWCYFAVLICIIGISKTYAAEYIFDYSYTQTYYNNNGSSVSTVGQSWNESLQAYVSNNINTLADSYGGGVSILSPVPILQNHTYTISFAFEDRSNMALSSKNRIAIGTSASNSANNYANSDYKATMSYSKVSNNTVFSFAFKSTINGTYIFIPFTTTSNKTQNYVMTKINIDDLGSEGISQSDINNSINNQTTLLQNQITDLQNGINSSINDMGVDITNSIDNNFNACRDSYNIFNYTPVNVTLVKSSSRTYNANANNSIELKAGTYTLSMPDLVLQNNTRNMGVDLMSNTAHVYVGNVNNDRKSFTFTITSDTVLTHLYIYLSSQDVSNATATFKNIQIQEGSVSTDYEPYGEQICSNRIDETNKKLDDLNKNLTDGNVDDDTGFSFFNNFDDQDHGGLSGIVTAPLIAINQMLNNQCSPLSTTFKGKTISFECGYSFWNRLTGFSTFINLTLGGLLCYRILIKLFKLIDGLKNPDDDRVEVMNL